MPFVREPYGRDRSCLRPFLAVSATPSPLAGPCRFLRIISCHIAGDLVHRVCRDPNGTCAPTHPAEVLRQSCRATMVVSGFRCVTAPCFDAVPPAKQEVPIYKGGRHDAISNGSGHWGRTIWAVDFGSSAGARHHVQDLRFSNA